MLTKDFRSLPEQRRRSLKDITYAAFETMVKGVAEAASQIGPRDKFHLIYDLSEEYSVGCLKLFNRLRAMHGNYQSLFASLSFADDTEFPPLQAADMLAHCERQKLTNPDSREPILKRILEILGQGKSGTRDLVYRGKAGLGEGVLELPIQ